jgi:hypothetical protein
MFRVAVSDASRFTISKPMLTAVPAQLAHSMSLHKRQFFDELEGLS